MSAWLSALGLPPPPAARIAELQRQLAGTDGADFRGLEEGDLPDLVVVDGGKGQLGVARAVMTDLGVEDVSLVSLAKSRVEDSDASAATTRSCTGGICRSNRPASATRPS